MIRITELLGAVITIIIIASCGSDDLDQTETQSGLNGEWTAVSFTTDIRSEVGNEIEMTTTQSSVQGYNFDYNLVIDDNNWTTDGNYETEISAQTNGVVTGSTTQSYTNINSHGSYIKNNNNITLVGNLFEYEMSGLGMTVLNNDNLSATYEINADGELIFTQEETAQSSMNGMTIRTTIQSRSVWIR